MMKEQQDELCARLRECLLEGEHGESGKEEQKDGGK